MERSDSMPDGVRQYKASWRSTAGSLTLFMLFMVFLFVVLGVATGAPLIFAACSLPFAWFAWLLGKPLFNGDWVLRVGPRGVSGHLLKNRTIPWRDVRSVEVQAVQGQQTVVLTLSPDAKESLEKTRRWLSGSRPERRMPLSLLRKQDIPEAIAALQETFTERGGAHAAAAAEARQQEVAFEQAFAQELVQRTKTTWALYLVVALNVVVWLLNVLSGVSPMRPTSPDLFRWGAISAWAVTRDGEYWRLLTGTFLHGGLIHLGMNMLGLWGAGKLLNRLYGNPQFLLIYFLSALAGASASLHFSAQTAVSVGASGAVFGVLGALLMGVRRHREHIPKAVTQQIITSEGVFMAYALLNGFTRQGIDNAAHVGGLVAGAAMGWVLAGTFGGRTQVSRLPRAVGIAGAVLAAIVAMVATTPSPRVNHGGMFTAIAQMQQLMPKLQAAQGALQKDAQAAKDGRMTEQQLLQAMQEVHLPAWRQVYADLSRVPQAKGDPAAELTGDLLEITGKSIAYMELQVSLQGREPTPLEKARIDTLEAEVKAASKRLQDRAAAAKKPK